MGSLFLMPKYILSGEGSLENSKECLERFGKKALIVTDEMMINLGKLDKVIEVLKKIDIKYEIYSKVNTEPTDIIVEEGVKKYIESKADFLIALGGGSPIDAMKAIGAMITNEGDINDYLGKAIKNAPPVLVAIPTTAGTGSETTQFTIISNTKKGIKMLLKGTNLIPTLAIVDPIFTVTAPKGVTAATGIDALCHAIEAYTSRKAQSLSDVFAVSAIKRIINNLVKAYEDGSDIKAREQMALASLEAGIAFNNSSVTIIHGMSRPIGAIFHVPHGLSNAMLLGSCLEFAKEGAKEKLANLAYELEISQRSNTEDIAADIFVKKIREILKKLNIQTLEEYGIEKEDFFNEIDKMSKDALDSGSPQNTMRIPSGEDIKNIYKSLWIYGEVGL